MTTAVKTVREEALIGKRVRVVTAASLFDGHDAAINIMRRILQAEGAEVIHLGHDRSVEEIVEAAICEGAHAVAVSSYQGGHMEFFRYLVDELGIETDVVGAAMASDDVATIQRELEVVRQMVTEKEEELERFTAALESHKSAVADEESKLSNLEDEAKREEEATQDRLNDFDGRIGSISERRTEWVDRIPPDVLRRYERVKSRREGVAITRIVEGRCSGCHINVPPQLQNVLARRDSLEICPQCNRYIYTPEDEDEDE